jgi:hypothetical protein
MADDRIERVARLLHEAGETHHVVWRIVDGDDPDWASWYSDWLINLSELPDILGSRPVRSELTWLLVELGKDYEAAAPDETWQDYYAPEIVRRLGADRSG